MKIANTKRIVKKLNEHNLMRRIEYITHATVTPLIAGDIIIDDADAVLVHAEKFQKKMAKIGYHYTKDESMIACIILAATEDISVIPSEIFHNIIKNSHIFHEGEIEADPFLRNIHLKDSISCGDFTMSRCDYEAYETFAYDIPASGPHGFIIPRIGAMDHAFSGPIIRERDFAWMSITPNEICTMKRPIAEASGNVLTLGCGLGYYAYMVSLKENVQNVTIIEKSQEIIDLFSEHILPQFEHKEKITIIHDDAFEYMERLDDKVYDYCFADIWQSNLDMTPYLKLKRICRKFKHTKMSYWIEDSLTASMIPYVSMIITNAFYNSANIDVSSEKEFLQNNLTANDQYILNVLEEVLQDKEITRPEHLDYYMNYRNIKHLLDS